MNNKPPTQLNLKCKGENYTSDLQHWQSKADFFCPCTAPRGMCTPHNHCASELPALILHMQIISSGTRPLLHVFAEKVKRALHWYGFHYSSRESKQVQTKCLNHMQDFNEYSLILSHQCSFSSFINFSHYYSLNQFMWPKMFKVVNDIFCKLGKKH